jgi:hypothetical protein
MASVITVRKRVKAVKDGLNSREQARIKGYSEEEQ